jgi:hypothetical protein
VPSGIDHGVVAVDVNEVIVQDKRDRRRRRMLWGSGAHITCVNHRSRRKAKEKSQCGSNVRSHGQSESP